MLAAPCSAQSSCAETHYYRQRAIDLAQLAEREETVGLAESGRIDRAELLDQHSCPTAVDFDLRPE